MNVLRGAVRGVGEVFITAGIVLLLFVVWQLWWTDVTATRVQTQHTQALQQQWAEDPPHPTPGAAAPKTITSVPYGEAFALIHIPRFGKGYARPILEGTSLEVLDEGVGHYVGAAFPGQIGNFAVAGHRVTYAKPFNRIDELRPGDPIVIETSNAWYVYRVVSHRIVTPDHTEVVAPVPNHPGEKPTQAMMTMTACHPKFSARQRYVLFSKLDQTIAKAPGVVPDVLRG